MFSQALKHWGSDDFPQCFKRAFGGLNLDDLPLFACCTHSGVIDKDSISVTILSSSADKQTIHLKIGVFFCEILSGCACSDDPSQAMILENSYCELSVKLNRNNATLSFN
ncbi:hypothetical protein [Candidatus Thioglobus sp.]|uniref:hypothetical protein n=1 Tax=Candidatus Thioglobus sp. TaxID=2026721 RepID=UPI00261193B0|nr:hypothetical protein [Candidatus Thioglobus sp.]MDG2395143.1 hypothetical protein [Candidatus Thioglobus sp.]